MKHKDECIAICKQYLQDLSIQNIFSEKEFNTYYRKNNGGSGNAFSVGLKVADSLILNFNPQQLQHESGN